MMTIKGIVTIKSEKRGKLVAELGKFVRCELLVASIMNSEHGLTLRISERRSLVLYHENYHEKMLLVHTLRPSLGHTGLRLESARRG